ncbi:hypothetical protein [Pseudonocardia dioxanivorans]|uniref:hypothetical protein n=1 Tax=Pseudonocardia dioxanivorans TaxID=240495 RepID=UPI000CD01178|nr:hypothetical protein [Pseudonocardia dioxanivorans]
MSDDGPDRVEAAAEELYGVPPDDFVPVRDELVAAAREAGDREAAKAIGRLRRPTQAAWLANLLARERAQQLDGLLSLASDLTDAQRTLDGAALRTLSAQRGKLVAAMAREARALAGRDGHRVAESTERDLRGILDAALADPGIADQVRSGRLHRTVSYSGFGPDALAGAEPRPAPRRPAPAGEPAPADGDEAGQDEVARDEQAERRARELADARRSLDDAVAAESEAREREQVDRDEHDDAARRLTEAKDRVADLVAELEQARAAQRDATEAERSAAATLRDSSSRLRTAAAEVERARARVEDLSG